MAGEPVPTSSVESTGKWKTVEQLARRVIEDSGTFRPGIEREDREAMLEDLMEIELRVRQIGIGSKAEKDGTTGPDASGRLEAALELDRRGERGRGTRGPDARSSRIRVGVAQAEEDSAEGLAASAPEVVRLRRSGIPRLLRLRASDPKRSLAIQWSHQASSPGWMTTQSWLIVGLGLGFWLGLGGLMARGVRPPGRLATGIVSLAAGLATIGIRRGPGPRRWGILAIEIPLGLPEIDRHRENSTQRFWTFFPSSLCLCAVVKFRELPQVRSTPARSGGTEACRPVDEFASLECLAFLALLAWQPLGFVAALGFAAWGRWLSD